MTQQMEQKNSEAANLEQLLAWVSAERARVFTRDFHRESMDSTLRAVEKYFKRTLAKFVLSDAETARDKEPDLKPKAAKLFDKLDALPSWKHPEGGEVLNKTAVLLTACAYVQKMEGIGQPSGDPRVAEVIAKLEKALSLPTFGIELCGDASLNLSNCRLRYATTEDVWCMNCRREADRDDAITEALALLRAKEGD